MRPFRRARSRLSHADGWQECVCDGLHVPRVGAAAATDDGDRRVLRAQPHVVTGQLSRVPGVQSWRLIEFGMALP